MPAKDKSVASFIPEKCEGFSVLRKIGFSNHLRAVVDQRQNYRDKLAKLERVEHPPQASARKLLAQQFFRTGS